MAIIRGMRLLFRLRLISWSQSVSSCPVMRLAISNGRKTVPYCSKSSSDQKIYPARPIGEQEYEKAGQDAKDAGVSHLDQRGRVFIAL